MEQGTSSVKILLVDDLDENLVALEALLKRDGLQLLLARSGAEALELLLVHDVALALIDVQMPGMDGFELAELMRGTERTQHVPIIFVTAAIEETTRMFAGYDAGAVDFLFKPIEPRILKQKTETFFQIHRQRLALEQTLRLNEELMAVVSHDLRNPLNVVLMTATALAGTSKDEEILKAATRLKSSGNRMVHIINELFDLARARLGGGIPIEKRSTDLLAVAKKTIAEFHTTDPERTIELRHEGNMVGEWDEARLEQVLSNLIGNAVRHGTPGMPIFVSLQGADADVTVYVRNAGHVAPEILPRLFEPFHSHNRKRSRTEGLGLGLYIVQQIVFAHGGDVDVKSTQAEGTTFCIKLPRKCDTRRISVKPSASSVQLKAET